MLGTAQVPQGIVMAPKVPELQECLDTAPRGAQSGTVGCAGPGAQVNNPCGSLPTQLIL